VSGASTLNQNVSWTIDRAGTTTKYRVVAYGDSIYAGYNGSTTNAAKFLRRRWTPNTCRHSGTPTSKACAAPSRVRLPRTSTTTRSSQSVRTCRPANTRVVTFEMCGNDGLQARTAFKSQTGTCDYSGMTTPSTTAKPTWPRPWTTSTPTPTRRQAEGHLQPVLPRLRRRQRAKQLQGRHHRRHRQPADKFLPASWRHQLLDV
jgi:lysophospholipase L1-like esterase